jgi:hypothetical protein
LRNRLAAFLAVLHFWGCIEKKLHKNCLDILGCVFFAPAGELDMRTLALRAGLLLCGTFLSNGAGAQVTPSCPTFAGTQSSGCGAIIDISGTAATVTQGPAAGPYDGSDDTLVGVANNIPKCPTPASGSSPTVTCGISIYSLDLTSTSDICGFDGDGINTFGAPGNAKDGTKYGGPRAFFSAIPPDANINVNKCRVNFDPPLAPGDSTYFSLENRLTSASTPCTKAINNSICDVNGANCGGTKPSVPSITTDSGSGRATQVQATFIPQGIDPNTGKKYTLAAAAQVCGFTAFDWQQTITAWPSANLFAIGKPTTALVPPFNDPPITGYTYMQTWKVPPPSGTTPGPISAPRVPVYYDPYNSAQAKVTVGTQTFDLSLAGNTPTANMLRFFDRPSNPSLPVGKTMDFVTHVVGLGTPPSGSTLFPVIDTGMGFTWTSNNNGTTGKAAVTAVPEGMIADAGGTGGPTILSVNQTSTYTGVGVTAINGSPNIFGPTSLLTAVLPASRSVQVNGTATAFATIINTGTNTATGCSIAPASGLPLAFAYRPTDPATNAVTGTLNTPVDIAAGASQSFVIGLTPSAAIAPVDLGFNFACSNTTPAPIVIGLNTLLFSASTTPTPDIIALAATIQNDGIVHVSGSPATGVFAVATSNLGAGASITVTADTGGATLPVTITMCQTNPQTGQCLQTRAPTVTATIASNTTPTFGIFVDASAAVPFDPANSRIFVKFKDSGNAVRGETSVAVTTQ